MTLLLVILAVPFAVPPIVENLITTKLGELGLSSSAKMSLGYCWRNGPGIAGDLVVTLDESPWRVDAEFGASCSEWSAAVKMDETAFDESDPALQTLLLKYPLAGVSNLTFSGSIALDARAERTFHTPVPVWSVKAPVRNFSAGLMSRDKAYTVTGLTVTPAASGIADRLDIAPLFPRARSISACGLDLTDFRASVRVTDKVILVTEASAACCGGQVNIYSLLLDPKNLNTRFSLFLEDVIAGEALSRLNGFEGEATGRLHGKIKLSLLEGGKAIRLSDAFLYSTPGETGKLKLQNPEAITDNLALAGFDEHAQGNVANALTDLDYSVLKLDLLRGEGNSATLSTTIRGTATRGDLSVPVELTLNINGELEQLINTGLGYSKRFKEKMKGQSK